MVLFLFVIMLLGVDRSEDLRVEPFKIQRPLAAIIGIGVIGIVGASVVVARSSVAARGTGISNAEDTGVHDSNIRQLAHNLFGDYVVAFEITSILLVVAVVGTVLLTRRVRSGATNESSGS